MKKLNLLCVIVCALIVVCFANRHYPEKFDKMKQSSNWSRLFSVKNAPPTASNNERNMNLTIALKHRNTKWLSQTFHGVSNPKSDQFGKFLTFEQINRMVSPDQSSIDRVLSWVHSFGAKVKHITPGREFISIELPAIVAQNMFQCEIALFEHKETKQRVYRTQEPYSIPAELSGDVAFVGNLLRFPKVRSVASNRRVLAKGTETLVNPELIKKFYNITGTWTVAKKNSQAVASFLEQYYDEKDLQAFWQKFNIRKSNVTVVGPDYEDQPGEEANLDIQYITAIGEGIPTVFVSNEGYHEGQEVFLKWIVNMTALGDECPLVHSVSYGDEENSITLDYAMRVDEEFQKMGVAGRTILFASGDSGAGCHATSDFDKSFVPDWPASSPYVTTVGGTRVADDVPMGEIAWKGSGGGFSNYFASPDWQQDAIESFRSQDNLPDPRFYNATGRGYPDLSALAVDYAIFHTGSLWYVDGTSAACPVVAGIISILNNDRLLAGKSPLGFLNYILYQNWSKVPNAFTDINRGRNAYENCPGFPATPGWDAISGFGTPNVGILRSLALQL